MTASPDGQTRLTAADGLEVIPIEDGVLLSTAVATLRLEGGVATFVCDRLLPALADRPSRADLWERWPGLPSGEAARVLDRLLVSGVVTELPALGTDGPPAWMTLVSADLDARQQLAERLEGLRLTVLGAGPPIDGVCRSLASAGVGHVVAARPAGSPTLAEGGDRPAEVRTVPVTRDDVTKLVHGQDMVIVMVEPSLASVRVWANEAGLAQDVPVLHIALDGTGADLGPLVLPGEGPCYLCWRMRALACEDDFPVAMAREEARDGARRPAAAPRPFLPGVAEMVAGTVVQEVLALSAGIGPLRLAHHVQRLESLSDTRTRHRVLPRPDCPACAKKDRPPQAAPSLTELLAEPPRVTPFDAIVEAAVSPSVGLVRRLDRVPKDITEPELPYVVRSELANSRFHPDSQGFVVCSGKGMSPTAARDTALGEALERHSSLTWDPPRRTRSTAAELPGPHLDPAELVLFADAQYDHLPHTAYSPATVLDWVPARSLATGAEVWVPRLAASLGYDVTHPAEYLFPATSNGFAAGPTLAAAVESALLEVLERDAFLLSWFHRLETLRIDAGTVPDEDARDLVAAYARRGVRLEVHLLPTDTAASVCLGVAWADDAPAVVVGLGASRDPVDAARKAVLEVAQVRPALRARLRDPETAARMAQLVADPSQVTELEDHDLLYADPGVARSGLDHWRRGGLHAWDDVPRREPVEGLGQLVASVVDAAGDVLYLDVTTPDVDDLGVKVARVIVPGFQPIHFGAGQARLGHPRLLEVPGRLGLRDGPAALADLNTLPHPLS